MARPEHDLSAPVTWAQLLARRRRELGLTQRELGEAAGLSQQAVSYIERGASVPRVTTMVRIARALGTTIEALFPMEAAPRCDEAAEGLGRRAPVNAARGARRWGKVPVG